MAWDIGAAQQSGWDIGAAQATDTTGPPVVNETENVSDAEVRVTSAVRVADETENVSDAEVRVATNIRVADDTENVSDAEVRVATNVRVADETENVSDAEVRVATNIRVADDTENVSDAEVRVATSIRVADETENVSDAEVRVATNVRVADETENVADAEVRVATNVRVTDETENVSETLTATLTMVVVVDDTMNISEGLLSAMTLVVVDDVNVEVRHLPLVPDFTNRALGPTEGVIASGLWWTKEVTGTIAAGDTFTRLDNGAGGSYQLPAGVKNSDTHVWLVSSHASGRGTTSGGGNQNLEDVTCRIQVEGGEYVVGPMDSILVERANAGAADCGFTVHILCWAGPDSHPLRMQVRHTETLLFKSVETQKTTMAFSATDSSRVLPYITSQSTDEALRTHQHFGFFTAAALQASGSDYTVQLTRGAQDGSVQGWASVALLEFSSGWDPVQRLAYRLDDAYDPTVTPGTGITAWDSTTTTNYGILDITQATMPTSGLAAGLSPMRGPRNTLLHSQYRINSSGQQGNDDAAVLVEYDREKLTDSAHADHNASSSTHLIIRASTTNLDNLKRGVVWILSAGPGARDMNVQHLNRYFGTTGTSEEQTDTTNDWTPLYRGVSDATNAMVWSPQANSDGTAAGVPRGFTDFQLPDPAGVSDEVKMVRSESSQVERHYVQVVEMPASYSVPRWSVSAWEQRRAGIQEWEQAQPGPVVQEQRRAGPTESQQSNPHVVVWEQRRAGIQEYE
jgi:hypothetical protein